MRWDGVVYVFRALTWRGVRMYMGQSYASKSIPLPTVEVYWIVNINRDYHYRISLVGGHIRMHPLRLADSIFTLQMIGPK